MKKEIQEQTVEQKQIKVIGRAFRIARHDQGFQMQQVAQASGVSRLTIGKIEKGKLDNCSLEVINRIATALEMKVTILVESKRKN